MLISKPSLLSIATLAVFFFGCESTSPTSTASGGAKQAAAGGSTGKNNSAATGGKKSTGNGGSAQKSDKDPSSSDGGATDNTDQTSTSDGGATDTDESTSQGGSGTNTRTSGKLTATGGKSSASGGKTGAGGTKAAAGAKGTDTSDTEPGAGGQVTGPGSYALPPPSQCHNQDYVPYESGCRQGEASSTCGGKCQVINACSEDSTSKPYADVTFICPRFMLFSKEMEQAAKDDGNEAFHYAIVGHDTDPNGIDGAGTTSTCCQCYQLVFAYPSPKNERQCLANPDAKDSVSSGIPVPPPLIVQSFNTAATPQTFDVYMGAGGLGAFNACARIKTANLDLKSASGQYLYTAYPEVGQPGSGGVKPVTHFSAECKNEKQWVTTETFTSDACQNKVKDSCNQIESNIAGLAEQTRKSCIQSNSPETPYHLNWSVYAMKVECPAHLTQVTGCKLASQGLPAVKRNVTTAEQAASDAGFKARASGGSDLYETTTMEDCCRPSCAAINWVEKKGLKPDGKYNAFYSCDAKGVPITEKE